ncbi:hypothetical protein [Citrobacter cronae]|uniref:hypothetical protein n=1 Tax=Citrobacter cronae TaxID=1748967 RepID=UPI0021D10629|nr:hypothetical protein [Citrobacter cronae]MCU6176156.1 hypothetical protein [Citrobacter cronae]
MCIPRILLPVIFLLGYCTITFASDSYVIDQKESLQASTARLNKLKSTYEKYQIKPEEKFTYTGKGSKTSLWEMQVVYRNYSATENDYIYISGVTGQGYPLTLTADSIRPLSDVTKEGVDSRISRSVLDKDMHSPAAKYYAEKYDAYHQRNVEFARRVISSNSCDTVIYADVYSFGGEYLNAVCGDRREIKQSLDDFMDNKPLDTSIIETYLVMPKNKLDALRQNH